MKYINYRVTALEPIKMGSQSVTASVEYCLDYLAGSSLRGAFIHALLKQYGYNLDKEKGIKKELLRQVYFLNAYPEYQGQRTTPAPFCFWAEKKSLAGYDGSELKITTEFSPGYKICRKESFVNLSKDSVEGVKVQKQFKLHVSVNNDKKDTDMFRYEVIERQQSFVGIIMLQDKEIESEKGIVNLSEKLKALTDNKIMYIGGSKGSGYGKCRVEFLSETEINPEINQSIEGEMGEDLYIYFLSDGILKNQEGEISSQIDLRYLKDLFGAEKAELKNGWQENTIITGYNNVWGTVLPQVEGIKAGTIQHYHLSGIKDISHAERQMKVLEERGIGDRRTDGYGRILFIKKPFQELWKRLENRREADKIIKLDKTDEEQLKMLVTSLYCNKLERLIDKAVVDTKLEPKKVSDTQIRNIMDILTKCEMEPSINLDEKFKEYFEQLEGRKNNRQYDRAFIDSCINKEPLKDILLRYAKNCQNGKWFMEQQQFSANIKINGIEPELSKQQTYQYVIKYLSKLCHYICKERKNEGDKIHRQNSSQN